MTGPYTTITVEEWNRVAETIRLLRRKIQRAREQLEKGATGEAIYILRAGDEDKRDDLA